MAATKAKIKLMVLNKQQLAIVQESGCAASYVSRCLNGLQKPSERLKKATARVTGLPPETLFEMELEE